MGPTACAACAVTAPSQVLDHPLYSPRQPYLTHAPTICIAMQMYWRQKLADAVLSRAVRWIGMHARARSRAVHAFKHRFLKVWRVVTFLCMDHISSPSKVPDHATGAWLTVLAGVTGATESGGAPDSGPAHTQKSTSQTLTTATLIHTNLGRMRPFPITVGTALHALCSCRLETHIWVTRSCLVLGHNKDRGWTTRVCMDARHGHTFDHTASTRRSLQSRHVNFPDAWN